MDLRNLERRSAVLTERLTKLDIKLDQAEQCEIIEREFKRQFDRLLALSETGGTINITKISLADYGEGIIQARIPRNPEGLWVKPRYVFVPMDELDPKGVTTQGFRVAQEEFHVVEHDITDGTALNDLLGSQIDMMFSTANMLEEALYQDGLGNEEARQRFEAHQTKSAS